ncbi:MAG: phosphoglycerate kinase [Candidatus Micrarchaeota archaeon]
MRKIADYEVRGKRILVRADLNCPIKDGQLAGDMRLRAHAVTIKELSDRGGRVIVLSHQGRKGKEDFTSLELHAKRLHQLMGKDVAFVDAVVGEHAVKAITDLNDGDILVLDNVRHLHCETEHQHGEGEIIHHLSPVADYYVLDALSVAHRKHSSVVGFSKKIPSFAGDVLAAEVEAIKRVHGGTDVTFIFGGSKVEDSFQVMKKWLQDGGARKILVGGALSVLMLYASGYSVGNSLKYLEDSGLIKKVPDAKQLLEKYPDKLMLPVDVGLSISKKRTEVDVENIQSGEILDIGEKTIAKYCEIIHSSNIIVMNGPAGVYEEDEFAKGTKAILNAVANSKAFSLLGGGHTISAIDKFNFKKNQFGYVSLSGKALIEYLCGEKLPGIVALEESEKRFEIS